MVALDFVNSILPWISAELFYFVKKYPAFMRGGVSQTPNEINILKGMEKCV